LWHYTYATHRLKGPGPGAPFGRAPGGAAPFAGQRPLARGTRGSPRSCWYDMHAGGP